MTAIFNKSVFASAVFAAFMGLSSQSAFGQASSVDELDRELVQTAAPMLLEYYEAAGFAPVFAGNQKRMTALLTALEGAEAHGLPVWGGVIEALERAILEAASPGGFTNLELVAAKAYVEFATALSSGLLNPNDISPLINFDTLRPEPADLLVMAADSQGNGALYEALEPQDPSYNALQAELAALTRDLAQSGRLVRIPAGRTLRPGADSERILAVRQRLTGLGYEGVEGDSSLYDPALVAALEAFQADHNLNADGIIGPKTLIALNTGPEARIQQVIVNLERRRWLNRELGARHILVNQASYMGYVVDNGQPTLVTRVVVGMSNAKYQTPEFIDNMTHMVVNPSWFVPQSIASEEYLPRLLRDPSVLARENIVMTVRGTGQPVDARLIDLSQYSQRNFPFNLRQVPGRSNALGRVKFMFPNQYNIYLHDTPAKSLFNRETRAYSHGCVRVQRPFDLAYTLLAPQSDDPQGTFTSVLNSGRETRIDLVTPVPIYLTYQTVFLDESGELAYRVDIYERDGLVFDALAENGVALPEVTS